MSAPRPSPLASRPERRKHARKDVIGSQLLSVDINDQQAGALIVDISEGGMALRLVTGLKSHGERTFTFKPPGHATRVELTGVPVWSDGDRLGIRFTNINDAGNSMLRSWINSLLPHEITSPQVAAKQQSTASAAGFHSDEPNPSAHASSVPTPIAFAQERLDSMAARARLLLSGTGAAVAWGNAEGMVCRATNGNAPPCGVPVDINRGLSGECVRTRAVVCCEDTESDHRVDPEVCRQLHLRSAIIVPIVSGSQILGLLEVFSDKPRAFSERDIPTLRTLATQFSPAEEVPKSRPAPVRQPHPQPSTVPARVVPRKNSAQATASNPSVQNIATVREKLAKSVVPLKRWRNHKLAGAALAVAAAVIAGSVYLAGHKASLSPSSTAQMNSAAHPAIHAPSSSSQPVAQLPRTISAQGKRTPASRRSEVANSDASGSPAVPVISIQTNPRRSVSNVDPQPPIIGLAPASPVGDSGLLAVLPSDTPLPKLTTSDKVSRISELKLVHQVAPKYPRVALLQRKEGTVVLRLSVGSSGRVKDAKVISGDEEFARAAIDAVRQWQYQPLRLDGKAMDANTNAIITFSLTAKSGQ